MMLYHNEEVAHKAGYGAGCGCARTRRKRYR